ncbi:type II toxin-antitoxin system RelE/ParE family toxin [Aequorivita marina]|nr:type II toxin-antitoxin system RelE/ParE family toxin [Aequorivita sp. S2608]MDS1298206.1 type II toxin-antitoxin system RelE/ParE family toxin [Aequorivita sp. S2608]
MHGFQKKTQKTPKKEIKKAERPRVIFLESKTMLATFGFPP